ncbi:hypothetical protein [Umezakia ovalisporum]|uniref:hypothetical protein n=1 Tax=Umezakia ovalisporum TaxID=75695 RepID=UPI002476475E|nr:hypothetical protein [Umezakia ovalisporum]MDH6089156.1 hypothetical protein [Umezakia ovalisporum Ak1311]
MSNYFEFWIFDFAKTPPINLTDVSINELLVIGLWMDKGIIPHCPMPNLLVIYL